MKKNISINISGIIFHIEEDGYDILKNYLDSVNLYFSRFEDSQEIVADIENRMAEIFLTRLSSSKQVISRQDVEDLIATMGTVADFAAIEDHEEPMQKAEYQQKSTTRTVEPGSEETSDAPDGVRKLYRDTNRKIIGGVAAGIAHHFNVDPIWIRLLFLFLFFSSASIGIESVSGLTMITYIIMWIVIPGSPTIEDNRKIKKLYRNPDNKVLGGVASGMAAYFGSDPVAFRLLFVLALFLGGSGFIIYIIFWIITPEAKTITDKIQMKGDPVTLSNIESSVKKNFNVEQERENAFIKIILFPFRLIAAIFSGIAKVLGPLLIFFLEAVRVFLGIILIIIGLSLMLSLVVATGIALGIYAGEEYIMLNIPSYVFTNVIPDYAVVLAFIALFIPFLALILIGITIIRKSASVNSTAAWSLFAVWLICLIGASATIPGIVTSFTRSGEYEVSQNIPMDYDVIYLDLNEVGMDNYSATYLNLIGYDGNQVRLVKNFKARGRTRQQAIENSKMVDYHVIQNDSILVFDSNITFKDPAEFRVQEVNVTLYLPYNQPFVMDRSLRNILPYSLQHDVSDRMENNQWAFTEDGLTCLTCPEED
ncbi:hypothetical protein BH23BAC1_BH23BAC1_37590 [soil metagenome]